MICTTDDWGTRYGEEEIMKHYIAGVWEGDGHMEWNNGRIPRFCISAHTNEETWAKWLIKKIGHGRIRYKKGKNALLITIGTKDGLKAIVSLLHGCIKTPKIYQFNLLIDWVNNNLNCNFSKETENKDYNNSWIAGFIDADGSFDIRYTVSKKNKLTPNVRIATRFRLDQRQYHPITGISYGPVLVEIANALNSKFHRIERKTKNAVYWNLDASTVKSVAGVISYLDNYPLKTSKLLNYLHFRKVSLMLRNKTAYENKETVKILKYSMNSHRTIYSWDHLIDS